MDIELDFIDFVIGYEHCKTCNNYNQCVEYITNQPNIIIKCIHFGLLKQHITEKENDNEK